MTRKVAQILTFIGGLYFFLEFLLPEELKVAGSSFQFSAYHQEISIGIALISSFAIGLGVINILLVHGQKILRSKKNTLPSLVLLSAFFLTLTVLFASWVTDRKAHNSWGDLQAISDYISINLKKNEGAVGNPDQVQKVGLNLEILKTRANVPAGAERESYREFLVALIGQINEAEPQTEVLGDINSKITKFKKESLLRYEQRRKESTLWKIDYLIFYGLFLPLGSSMFSILGFYITYAAFRSFRVRSKESTVMMLAALIVILGQIPQGVMYISPHLPNARLWIMEYISTPAFRAIYFCSALAGLSLAVRMWFSMDKNPFLQR